VDVVDALHETGVLAPGKAAKIAMPNKDDSAGGGLARAATSLNQDSPTPAPVVKPGLADQYPDPDKHPVNWQEHIENITNYSPHIILAMGTGEFVSDMMEGIEKNWKMPQYRPWYLLPEGDRVTELKVLLENNPGLSLNERILGTAPGARRSSLYDSFAASFQALFKNRDPGNLAEFGYDAGYLVAYAIAIANKASPSGRELATALQHVSCKDEGRTTVSVGPAMFSRYFGIAATGGCIDFEGASGPLDFNAATGEALSDIATWCMRPNGDGTYDFEPPLTGYYSVEDSRMKDENPPDLTQRGWCAQQ
jgi:branched-chain amino acid transport system substrate-binding protein